MNRTDLIGEIAACIAFMALMIGLLIFGTAIIPYQPGMHSEETYAQSNPTRG